MKSILTLLFVFGLAAGAEECSKAELATLQNAAFVNQIAPQARLYSLDCVATRGQLIALYVVNARSGLISKLAAFSRAGFSVKSQARVKSDVLGLDSFPILVEKQKRLLVLMPDPQATAVYINPQTGPSATKFSRWTLDGKSFSEDTDHSWLLDAGKPPQVHLNKGRYQALIQNKTVPL